MRKGFLFPFLVTFATIIISNLFLHSFWVRTTVIFTVMAPTVLYLSKILSLHIEGCRSFDEIKGDGIEYTLTKKLGGITQLAYIMKDDECFLINIPMQGNFLGFPKNAVKPGTRFIVTKEGRIKITTIEI